MAVQIVHGKGVTTTPRNTKVPTAAATGGSSITSPFHPPQQLTSHNDAATSTTVTVQAGLKVSDDEEMLDFDNLAQFTEHFKEIPCCILNMGVLSYCHVRTANPTVRKHALNLRSTWLVRGLLLEWAC